jgi:hypothetical protein
MTQETSSKAKSKTSSKAERLKIQRQVYFEILEGYTPALIHGEKSFIKHFDLRAQTAVDAYYQEIYEDAQEKGLLTEAQLLEQLIEDGIWSKKEEDHLHELGRKLKGAHSTLAKLASAAMRESLEESIKRIEEQIAEAEHKKGSLIENTCEQFSEKKSSDLVVKLAFYKEDKVTPFYSDEEFDMLERGEILELIGIHNKACTHLKTDTLRAIAIADFFTAYFSLVDSEPSKFFAKPVYELTFFQVNLLSYARIYSNILKNLDPPEHIREDPDRLLSFAQSQQKKRDAQERKAKKPQSAGPPTLS